MWGKCHEVTKGDRRRQRLSAKLTEGEITTPPSRRCRANYSPAGSDIASAAQRCPQDTRDPWQVEAPVSTCGNDFHELKIPHNNKHFLNFNITFFIKIFKLYMQIELSRNCEITLFLMVWQKLYRYTQNHTKENAVENFVFKQKTWRKYDGYSCNISIGFQINVSC